MTVPLVVLAVLSVVGGFMGFPHGAGHAMHIPHWLDHFLETSTGVYEPMMSAGTEAILMVVATLVAVASLWYAWRIYKVNNTRALEDSEIRGGWHKLLLNKYWVDELYDSAIRKPLDAISHFTARWTEPKVVDGAVDGAGNLARNMGSQLRKLQNGRMYIYIASMVIALIAMLIWKT
jgi:NADH-quinone oxidoreductase subunit L